MGAFFKKQTPARIIASGFVCVILLGSLLLSLPCSVREGIHLSYLDALYTSTSAVCVTGLAVVDPGDTFTPVGQLFLGLLIQVGGLGVTAVGAGVILAMGKRVNLKGRNLIREAMNLKSGNGIILFLKSVFYTTIIFELAGAFLCFFVFCRDYEPATALGISLFHSVAAFNNAGFDIFGGGQSMIPYQQNIWLNFVTAVLVFFGGIGFLVIHEVLEKRFRWRRFSMHTKVVLFMSFILIAGGTLLLRITEDITWLGAFFQSVSARTAGFATYSLSSFSSAGLIVMIVLMLIGASPGSTGGGIKTSTVFVLFHGIKSAATNQSEKAFHYSIPAEAFRKASVITMLAIGVVMTGTFLMLVMEPDIAVGDALFEVVSAFGTTGLSTGITSSLGTESKILSILLMYIGRLGPLTVASLWYFHKGERTSFPQGDIAIG